MLRERHDEDRSEERRVVQAENGGICGYQQSCQSEHIQNRRPGDAKMDAFKQTPAVIRPLSIHNYGSQRLNGDRQA